MTAVFDFEQSLHLVGRWVSDPDIRATTGRPWLDQSVVNLEVTRAEVFRPSSLLGLARRGHHLKLRLDDGSTTWTVQLRPDGRARNSQRRWEPKWDVTTDNGSEPSPWSLIDFLGQLGDVPASLEVTLLNHSESTGFHWTPSLKQLIVDFEAGWVAVLEHLFYDGDGPPQAAERQQNRRQLLRVEDAGEELLESPGLVLYGPGATPPALTSPDDYLEVIESGRRYRDRWLKDKRGSLPSPVDVLPMTALADGAKLRPAADLLHQVAQGLVWMWIATSSERNPGKTTITFEDAEPINLTNVGRLALSGSGEASPFVSDNDKAEEAIELWKFATRSPDQLRRESVIDAYLMEAGYDTTTVPNPRALLSRATRLYRYAQKERTTEAMATARSSQQAAVDAATKIADATRSTARSIIDRAFIQMISVAGILIAHGGDALSSVTAVVLLGVVFALGVVTLAVALVYEYPAAKRLHQAFVADIRTNADLAETDRLWILGLEVLRTAEEDLGTSQRAAQRWLWVPLATCIAATIFIVA